MVEIAIPTGTEVFFDESKNAIGMMQETPKPTNTNPTVIKKGWVKTMEIKKPADKSKELVLMIFISPNLSINLSPQNLPISIAVK